VAVALNVTEVPAHTVSFGVTVRFTVGVTDEFTVIVRVVMQVEPIA
jgi:hypothetical protein